MKKILMPSLLVTIAIFTSCKKDGSTNSGSSGIQGTYKFKYITAKTSTSITDDQGEKEVTVSDYTTTGNQGTLVFDNANINSLNVGYSVDTLAYTYIYQDNILEDSSSFSFAFTYPPTSSVSAYKLVGSDSIYFPGGSIVGNTVTQASGGKYVINGKLLTITQKVAKDSSFSDSGINYQSIESGTASIIMEKQ